MSVDELLRRLHDDRARLHALAYRMLGSVSEADDALQEAWIRVRRGNAGDVHNADGWLTTAVAHTCLDLLRARRARREEPAGVHLPDPIVTGVAVPEAEAVLAETVGYGMQAVLASLSPAERVAFVLHDSFDVPFDRIGAILDRSPEAARQLASRARRRVRAAPVPDIDPLVRRRAVEAFFAAARRGDFDALLAVLDPQVVVRADAGAGAGFEVRGAADAARRALLFARPSIEVRAVLVNGTAGAVMVRDGEPQIVGAFTVTGGVVAEIFIIADPDRVRALLSRGDRGLFA